MRLFKTGEKRGKGRIKKLFALVVAGTMLAGSVSYAAGMVKGLFFDLDIMGTDDLVKDSKTTKNYTNQSGFCTDDAGNLYIARINNKNKNVKISKSNIKNNKKWTKIYEGLDVGHANDMTYCNGKLYICSKSEDNRDVVIKVLDPNGNGVFNQSYKKSKFNSTIINLEGKKNTFNCSPSGIAYDDYRKVFYLTQKRNGQYIVSVFKLNKDGSVSNVNKDQLSVDLKLINYNNYETQGITYKDNVLYIALWEPNKTVDGKTYNGEGPNNSIVVPYTITEEKGSYKFKKGSNIRLDQDTKKNTKFEIEGLSFVGDRLYMAVNADGDTLGDNKGDAIYFYDPVYYDYLNCVYNDCLNRKLYEKSLADK